MRMRSLTQTMLAVMAIGIAWPATSGDALVDLAAGRRLYDGTQPLVARIAGQDLDLPAAASRCANCHRLSASAPPSTTIGPLLEAATLTMRRPRRGGPPSAYAEASFCRVLRTGIDAASVIVDRRMPRYAVSDAECGALWAYVTQRR